MSESSWSVKGKSQREGARFELQGAVGGAVVKKAEETQEKEACEVTGKSANLGVHSPSGLHTPVLLLHQHPLSSHVVSGRHLSRGPASEARPSSYLPPRPASTPEECLLSLLSDGGGGNRWLRAIIALRHPSPPSRLHMRLTPGKEANTPPVLSSDNALSHP